MDNITFEVAGYTAILKPFLTFGQRRQLKRTMLDQMSITSDTKKEDVSVKGSVIQDAEDQTMKMVLIELRNPTGEVFTGDQAFLALQNLEDETVGDAIYAKVNEITASKQLPEDKKKEKI